MTHDSRSEKPAARSGHRRPPAEDAPTTSGSPSGGVCETDEFGLPIARPGSWLPDLDGEFELLDG